MRSDGRGVELSAARPPAEGHPEVCVTDDALVAYLG